MALKLHTRIADRLGCLNEVYENARSVSVMDTFTIGEKFPLLNECFLLKIFLARNKQGSDPKSSFVAQIHMNSSTDFEMCQVKPCSRLNPIPNLQKFAPTDKFVVKYCCFQSSSGLADQANPWISFAFETYKITALVEIFRLARVFCRNIPYFRLKQPMYFFNLLLRLCRKYTSDRVTARAKSASCLI